MKIHSIVSTVVDLPIRRAHKLAMTTMSRHTLVIVQVRTEDGAEGLGEMSVIPGYNEMSAGAAKVVIDDVLAPQLRQQDPRQLWQLVGLMDRAIKGNFPCKAAIEMACVDLTARALGVSASALFGGPVRDRLPLLWVLASGDTATDIAEAQERLSLRTHRHFLVKIGAGDPRENIGRAVAIRQALPDAASVRVDVNQGWDEATARWAIPALQSGGISVIEQPVSMQDARAMQRLTRGSQLCIMADEAIVTPHDAIHYASERMCDAFSIKVIKHGGLLRNAQVAQIANAAGIGIFGGTMIEGCIGTSACAQLYATLPELQWDCQLFGPQLLTDDVAHGGLLYEDHALVVPQGPGFGAQLDRDKLAFYQRRQNA